MHAAPWTAGLNVWFVMLVTQILFVDGFLHHDQDELAGKNLEAFYWLYRHRDPIIRRIPR